jgi:hypothetical protein
MMKHYDLTYTGNDGLPQEHEYYGSHTALLTHIDYLEERGCHGLCAMDGDRTVYDNGGPI